MRTCQACLHSCAHADDLLDVTAVGKQHTGGDVGDVQGTAASFLWDVLLLTH